MTSSRVPQQQRSRGTVERILAAADAELGDVGPAAASTRSIAARAGVSVGALYRFFDDKTAVADALAQQYLSHARPPFAAALERVGAPADVVDAVHEVVRIAAELQLEHPGYYRLTEELAPDRDDSPAHVVRSELVALFVAAVRRAGVREQDHDDAHVRLVVELAVETVRHTLVRAPTEPVARSRVVVELQQLVGTYLSARLLGGA